MAELQTLCLIIFCTFFPPFCGVFAILANHLPDDFRFLSDILEACFEGRRKLILRGPTFHVLLLTYLSAFLLKPSVATDPSFFWAHLATFDLWDGSGLWSDSRIQMLMLQAQEDIYRKMELALCGGSL